MYTKIVGEEFADFRVDKHGLLEDRDAFWRMHAGNTKKIN